MSRQSRGLELLAFCLLLLGCLSSSVQAEPIGWMEEYALSNDRETKLAELIPGSDDYFFYHCLYFQTTGQLERSEAMLRQWLAEHKGRETPAIAAMTDRQRLLTYRDSPQRTIDHLKRRLQIKLDHAPPATRDRRRYPSELDQSQLDVDRLVREALQRSDTLKPMGIRVLARHFSDDDTTDFRITLRDLLSRIDGPYVENLSTLVAKELKSRRPQAIRFGDLSAHRLLTLDELREVADAVPEISDDDAFVQAILMRLRPDADSDISQQSDRRLDYLQRVEAYVRTLPASYNSLKASSLYRLLEAKLKRGQYDRALFLRYLELPRQSPLIPAPRLRGVSNLAQPNENFMQLALLPPIGDERPLVRQYLEHFLRDAEDVHEFSQYLKPEYLGRVFAETKLLYGIGSQDQWYKMLAASQRQALRDQVELRLAPINPEHFPLDKPTKLVVDIKNVQELVVRVYEINTSAYYRTHRKPIDTDIDLDGLLATDEKTRTFNQPSVRRHREEIELPGVEGRGVWVVDLVGKGLRARALVRRGDVDYVQTTIADGMLFTIIDENRKPIPAATMWIDSRELIADDKGRIVVPPVSQPANRSVIISDGALATHVRFDHIVENYHLNAGMHLDRTQLQAASRAELLVRPRLLMNGAPIDPATLKDLQVQLEATDLEGLSITHQIEDLKLDQAKELVVPFRVPARLANLKVTLTGKLSALSDGRQRTVSVSNSWDVAGSRRTLATHDAFLTRDGDDFVVEVRGRNGEVIPGATVSVSMFTELRQGAVQQTFQSDDEGRIRLGSLPHVTSVTFGVVGGPSHHRDVELDRVKWPGEIHTTSDQPVRLSLVTSPEQASERYRLIELRDGAFHGDRSDQLQFEPGMLTIAPLSGGNYRLLDRHDGSSLQLEVVSGPLISSVATGRTRHREVSPTVPLGIASLEQDKDGLKIQLTGDVDAARVHVYASRFLDSANPLDQLALPPFRLSGRSVHRRGAGYVSDLQLGDEYQYVLRRRHAKKYPGVMLPQPGVILNPWETEETSNETQRPSEGEAPPATAAEPRASMSDRADSRPPRREEATASHYEFLANPGVLLPNLRADKNGVIEVPASLLEHATVIQVVATDAVSIVQRSVARAASEVETADLRLAQSLQPDVPFTFRRGVSIASRDQPLDLKSLGSTQLQVYASVGDLWKFYKTLVNDSRANQFDVLARWHELDSSQKMDAYARLASHELHLFVYFHDPSFFEEVVASYLQNKKEKQFVDHWLLEEDLSPYTELWKYNQLNAAERALLAMRVPEVRESIRRELKEVVASQQEDYEATRRLVESALRSEMFDMDYALEKQAGAVELSLGEREAGGMVLESLSEAVSDLRRRKLEMADQHRSELGVALNARPEAKSRGQRFMGRGVVAGGMGGASLNFFRDLDSTKQWAESQWDRERTVGGPAPGSLVAVDAFWADVASNEGRQLEVSSHLLRPIQNRHAALTALAMCGLPLTAGEVDLPSDPKQLYKPAHAVAVVTRQLKRLEDSSSADDLLIGQRFEAVQQRSDQEDEAAASELKEFLVGTAYRGQIVVSNPTARRRVVEVFWQLPEGSLPLAGHQMTDSRTVQLKPYAVESLTYEFYFPSEGSFTHYPANVSREQTLLAQANEKSFKAVKKLSDQQAVTWQQIAESAEPERIREFLAEANLRQIDWMLVAHRMKDKEVYDVIVDVLRQARLPLSQLWAYGFEHEDEPAMQSFLALQEELVGRAGPVLESPLLQIDPIEREMHELLEYAPLVRARIHRLGQREAILNPTFYAQYMDFARILGYSREITSSQRLVLAYYLLIQNRISDAIEQFGQVDPAQIATRLQYDYMHAYLAMHQGQYAKAEQIAREHSEHPVPRWKQRFNEMLSQLRQQELLGETEKLVKADSEEPSEDQLEGIAEGTGDLAVLDHLRQQEQAAKQQPEVIVRVEGDTIRIDHRRTRDVVLNFYGVDLELLFSKAPFGRDDLQRMATVTPMRSEALRLDRADGTTRFQLSDNLRRQTLLVEAVAGAERSTTLYYGGDITTYVSESYGQLQASESESGRPIATAYVKVYARYPDGDVRFYKDGYTDGRGRFDYATISAAEAKGATRFAVLVISQEQGATLHDVAAPNQ